MVDLGAEFLPSKQEALPAPDPGIELLREIKTALLALPQVVDAVAAIQRPAPVIPAPYVHVAEPDLSAIVTAVNGLKPGADTRDLARMIASELNPQAQSDQSLMVEAMRELVEKIDFRLQGVGRAFGSSGPSNISDNADRLLGHVTVDSTPGSTFDTNQVGTWGYVASTLTSGSLTGVGRCIGIRVVAQGADGTFNVNGGNTITARQSMGVDINPLGNVSAPVVNWVSGTLDVIIEGLS